LYVAKKTQLFLPPYLLMDNANVSVLIITLNEEHLVGRAISSVLWSNDIVIVDSFSSDRTKEVALGYPHVRLFEKTFEDYSSQRNFGLHEIEYRNKWVFLLDADEICTPALVHEMIDCAANEDLKQPVFLIRRKDFFMNRWMRCHHPTWLERLVRPNQVTFLGSVHERLSYSGIAGKLTGYIYHYPFDNGIEHWIARHNRYTTLSAALETAGTVKWGIRDLLSRDPLRRWRCIKEIYQKLPWRYLIYFFYRYIIKRGFLDGICGLHFVLLETFYHFTAVAKIRALKSNGRYK
jgi:glycosyltransferase involved in cell wall biosynthesis